MILGVDPGLAKCGWGVIEVAGRKPAYIDSGIITTSARAPHIDRLRAISAGIQQVLSGFSPALIGIERVFINRNPNSSLLLGEARGAILITLINSKAPVLEISALQIKQSVTGAGRAGKQQVADMVGRLLGISTGALKSDCTDALACALTANSMQNIKIAHRPPPRRRRVTRRALAKLVR